MELGFISLGVSRAGFLEEDAPRLEQWLRAGHHGSMAYMENHFDKRLDPRKLVDGARSVVSVLYNYFPERPLHQPDKKSNSAIAGETVESTRTYKISKYAYGEDYHRVVKDRLRELGDWMRMQYGNFSGRVFVDSAPVMDKSWARRAGLGWIGKNSNLITPKVGSFFFIGEFILDLDFEPDGPITDHCGTCTRCIDACPTEAIVKPYVVDGSKCISHLTIELKDAIPDHFKGQMDGWMFGCDVCQDVCPWNRFSVPHQEARFNPSNALSQMTASDWEELTEETFKKVFQKSAVKRTKYAGLVRNIRFLQEPGETSPGMSD